MKVFTEKNMSAWGGINSKRKVDAHAGGKMPTQDHGNRIKKGS